MKAREEHRRIEKIFSEIKTVATQVNPVVPGLIRHPDLLMVPEAGRLCVVEIKVVDSRDLRWQETLALFEAAFEYKAILGEGVSTGLVISSNVELESHDQIQLLNSVYDQVFVLPKSPISERKTRELLKHFLSNLRPNENRNLFWRGERLRGVEISHSRERSRREASQAEPREFLTEQSAREFLISELRDKNLDVAVDVEITNQKHLFIGQGRKYSFVFDVTARDEATNVTHVYEVMDASRGSFRTRALAFLARNRLLNYRFFPEEAGRREGGYDFRIALYGKKFGPDHDPFRFFNSFQAFGVGVFLLGKQDPIL